MEEKAICKPSMVSRLPKFGVRSEATVTSQSHGSSQQAHNQDVKSTGPKRPNGVVRIPSFSLKWKKEGQGGSPSPEEGPAACEAAERDSPGRGHEPKSADLREIKKPSAPAKGQRQALLVAPTNLKTAPLGSKAAYRSGAKPGQRQSLCGGKPRTNGIGVGSGLCAASGLPRPQASSGLGPRQSESQYSLLQSTDSLGSLPPDTMVRSRSFTHFTQLSSHAAPPITRSFSFSRAVELARPLADTQLRPLSGGQGPGARLTAPATHTRPLPAGCTSGRATVLGSRLARRSRIQPPRLLPAGKQSIEVAATSQAVDSMETPPATPEPSSDRKDIPVTQSQSELPLFEEAESALPYLGEGLEEMSLSSGSSLERNDTSEEYLDDFDNLGDGGGTLLAPICEGGLHQSQPHPDDSVPDNRHLFLRDRVDWAGPELPGMKDDFGVSNCAAPLTLSPGLEILPASSLELSPSNSSGGTYMWDEEGLEPLGSPPAHLCASYDSDINSTDILNELDNLESCDLDDDDLMLDADLPEDGSLHSDADGMSHFERSERGGRQGNWRRRQHRWSGPDHYQNDNRSGLFHSLDGLGRAGSQLPKQGSRSDGYAVELDEATVRHMAQDCSSVKSQLLQLKNLLQMDDGVVIHNALASEVLSPEPAEDLGPSTQVEELMKEVRELREELRSKDRTIAQLTQQLATRVPPPAPRCQCQQRALGARGERRSQHYDKGTQTPWKGQPGVSPAFFAPPWQGQYQGSSRASVPPRRQILQSSTPVCHNEHHLPERLARTAPTEDPSDVSKETQDDRAPQGLVLSSPPANTAPMVPGTDEVRLLLSTPIKIQEPQVPHLAAGTAVRVLSPGLRRALNGPLERPAAAPPTPAERPPPGMRPRVLQSPRFHRRVLIPALTREGAAPPDSAVGGGANTLSGSPAVRGGRRLTPSSRGLPCFSPTLPRRAQVLGHTGGRCPEDSEGSVLQPTGLVSTSYSRLPKPKIH